MRAASSQAAAHDLQDLLVGAAAPAAATASSSPVRAVLDMDTHAPRSGVSKRKRVTEDRSLDISVQCETMDDASGLRTDDECHSRVQSVSRKAARRMCHQPADTATTATLQVTQSITPADSIQNTDATMKAVDASPVLMPFVISLVPSAAVLAEHLAAGDAL